MSLGENQLSYCYKLTQSGSFGAPPPIDCPNGYIIKNRAKKKKVEIIL